MSSDDEEIAEDFYHQNFAADTVHARLENAHKKAPPQVSKPREPVEDEADVDDLVISDIEEDEDDDFVQQLVASNFSLQPARSQQTGGALDAEAQLLEAMALNRKLKLLEQQLQLQEQHKPVPQAQRQPIHQQSRAPSGPAAPRTGPAPIRRVSSQGATAVPRRASVEENTAKQSPVRRVTQGGVTDEVSSARATPLLPASGVVKGVANITRASESVLVKDASHRPDEVRTIHRENLFLLSRLEEIHKKGGHPSLKPSLKEVKHVAGASIHRKKSQQAVLQQNLVHLLFFLYRVLALCFLLLSCLCARNSDCLHLNHCHA
eukprot:m.116788 g.116788  ORF g.116788 m.116788 type:complete len:320 (-) comp51957_c0_seq6:23-982(-)